MIPVRTFFSFVLIVYSFLLGGCKGNEPAAVSGPAVTVSKPIEQEVMEWDEFSGRLESPKTVNVSSRVDGLIVEAPFVEGSVVQQGDLLFNLDDRPYKAELAQRNAAVASAQARLQNAKSFFNRLDKIRGSKAISADELDQARAAFDEASATFEAAKAAMEIAALNLEWTHVTAPITGRIGKKLVTEGNLVKGGDSDGTLLTTITSIDPLYIYVNVPERTFLKYQAIQTQNTGAQATLPCKIQLENETNPSRTGIIDFFDNHVDPATGTIQVRGVIANKDGLLSSGLFARMKIPSSLPYKAVLIPTVAIGTDQTSKFVLVVDKDNTVIQKRVTLGAQFGPVRAITEGLSIDDKVIVNGLQIAKPNTKVTPTEVPVDPQILAMASAGAEK